MSEVTSLAQLHARLDALEAHVAVRGVMTDYMRLCDQLNAAGAIAAIANLFAADAVWTGIGARYAQAFGTHHGREAILGMLESHRNPPHFVFNAHFLTSEKLQVAGDTAHGSWMMLQTSTYSSGSSDLRSAHLEVAFCRTGSRWHIQHFATENLFSRRIDRWNDEALVAISPGA